MDDPFDCYENQHAKEIVRQLEEQKRLNRHLILMLKYNGSSEEFSAQGEHEKSPQHDSDVPIEPIDVQNYLNQFINFFAESSKQNIPEATLLPFQTKSPLNPDPTQNKEVNCLVLVDSTPAQEIQLLPHLHDMKSQQDNNIESAPQPQKSDVSLIRCCRKCKAHGKWVQNKSVHRLICPYKSCNCKRCLSIEDRHRRS